MSHFFKTELGQNALQQRNIALTAKQRRLLLLIDHEDFQELDHNYKEKIAPSELVQQLIDMGLLAQQAEPTNIKEIPLEQTAPIIQSAITEPLENNHSTTPSSDEETFEKTQEFINKRKRFVGGVGTNVNPFASFIKCQCGATMNQIIIKSNNTNLYRCAAKCGVKSVNRDFLISEVKKVFEENAKLLGC